MILEDKRAYQKKYREKNADKIRQQNAEWRANNKERVLQYAREYYRNNKDEILTNIKSLPEEKKDKRRKAMKKWRDKNKERLSDYNARYREDNKERLGEYRDSVKESRKIYFKEYYRDNPHIRRQIKARYRARKVNATPNWLDEKHFNEMKEIYKNCPDGFHVDHIIPLQGEDVCGLHVPWNLQHLTAEENLRKGNRYD